MFSYFFHVSWRYLTKRGVFSIINILSLAVGLAVVLLICLFICNEFSFDKSFKEGKNIYRMNSYLTQYKPGETYCTTANAAGPAMKEAVPDVLATVRTYVQSYTTKVNEQLYKIDRFCWADEDFFRLFDTPFLYGSPEKALTQPNSIAISEKMAKRLFGDKNPVGETLMLDNQHQMEISAVYKDFPESSSFASYQMIGPFMHSYPEWIHRIHWSNIIFETFCLLADNANPVSVEKQMKDEINKSVEEGDRFFYFSLQRLDEIHLYSAKYQYTYTNAPSDIGKVSMLSLLAVIILLVACINYMNLSTARAQKRSKEIGISKTLGAKRGELVLRLFFETGFLTLISFVVALLLAYLLLPLFNHLLGERLSFGLAFNPLLLAGMLLIWIVTTLVAASYPVFYLSGFPPLIAIRQGVSSGKSGHAVVRKVLTIGQFSVAIVLIVWVIIIQTQMQYVNNKDIGYNPHNLIGISLISLPREANLEGLVNDYKAQSSVITAAFSQGFPINRISGRIFLKDAEDKNGVNILTNRSGDHLEELLQLKLITGKTLPSRIPGDTVVQAVLNRKAVEYMGVKPEEAVGKKAWIPGMGGENIVICGVVEDFNSESLYRPVSAFAIHNGTTESIDYLLLRIKEGSVSEQLNTYERIFKKHFPNHLFEVRFPDVELEKVYEAEYRTNHVAVCFSFLAILVACLGVFGLTAFMAEQRTKEIGVRKVMGANINDIVSLFTNDYLKLLFVSLVISVPVAWWVGNNYLQNFAFRISLSWWMFVLAAVITVVLTILTVCWQALKAARVNPVKSIKTE